MKNSKKTKRAWLLSLGSVLTCSALLAGTTYAWFTDSVSTGTSIIAAGNLDVDLVDKDGKTVAEQTLPFLKAAGAKENEEVLWEPGCTYQLKELFVQNKGTLDLKYKLDLDVVAGPGGNEELMDALVWTVNGVDLDKEFVLEAGQKSGAITVKAHMKEDAGNEYQGLSLKGAKISLVATQTPGESDSFGSEFDKYAAYGESTPVSSVEDMKKALTEGAESIMLTSDVALTENMTIDKDVVINGNGNTISGKPMYIASNANVEVINTKFDAPTNAEGNASNFYASSLAGSLVIDGCTFTNTQWDSIQVTPVNGAEITIKNSTFENTEAGQRFIHIQAKKGANCDAKVTITNNTFKAPETGMKNSLIDVDYIDFANLSVSGNKIAGTAEDNADGDLIYICNSEGTMMDGAEAFNLFTAE